MAINPHHIVEEINGIRCSIIEKKATLEKNRISKGFTRIQWNGSRCDDRSGRVINIGGNQYNF